MKNPKKLYKREKFTKEIAIKNLEKEALEELKSILLTNNISHEAIK